MVKGWHARPGKETVGDQSGSTGRSVTLWNGACRVGPRVPVDKHVLPFVLNVSQTNTQEPLTVSTTDSPTVDS